MPFYLTVIGFACLPFSVSAGGLALLLALVTQAFAARGNSSAQRPDNQLSMGPAERRIYLLMALFLLLTLLQTSWVADPGSHLGGLGKLYAAPFLVYWLVRSQRLDRRRQVLLLQVIVASAALQAGFGIYEYFGGRLDWRFLPIGSGNDAVYLLDLSLVPLAPGRAHGIMMYPTLLSGLLLLALPLACGLVEGAAGKWERFLSILALPPLFVCLVLTFTRSGWLAVVPILLIFGMLSRHWKTVGLAFLSFCICLTILVSVRPAIGQQLATRLQSITSVQDVSNAQRLSIWRSYLAVVRDYFWIGTGINSGGVIFPHYRRPDFPGALVNPHAHDWYLQVMNESGVPLAALFFTIFALPLRKAWQEPAAAATAEQDGVRIIRAALTAAVVGFLLLNFLDYLAHEVRLNLIVWLCLALLNSPGYGSVLPIREPRATTL